MQNRTLRMLMAGATFVGFATTATAQNVYVRDSASTEGLSARIPLDRTGKTNVVTTGTLTTYDDTAKAGVDYNRTVTRFSFPKSVTRIFVPVGTIDNTTYQGQRRFRARVTSLSGGKLQDAEGYNVIVDDETAPPPEKPWAKCANEGELCYVEGSPSVRYGVPGSWSTPKIVTGSVSCTNAVFGDPAVNKSKICETDGIVGTAPPIEPPVEPPIEPPVTGSLISFNSTVVPENVGFASLTLTRTGDLSQPLTVEWWPQAETAIQPQDYVPNSGTHTIPAESATANIGVGIVNDTDYEKDESFLLHAQVSVNGVLQVADGRITIQSDDAAPNVPPMVVMEPPKDAEGNILSPSLEGVQVQVTDHDYMTSLQPAWGTGAIPSQYPPGNGITGDFRQICGEMLLANNDHIVFFGQPGKSHLHNFNGNSGVNASSTTDTLIYSGDSSCNFQSNGHAVQRSSYWKPALMTYKTVVNPVTKISEKKKYVIQYDWASLYYKGLPDSGPNKAPECGPPGQPRADGKGFYQGICIQFPNGLRVITGSKLNPNNPNDYGPAGYRMDAQPIDFYCTTARNGGVTGSYMNLDDLKKGSPQCSEVLARDNFPDCWDGKYLWRTDRNHIVYGGYGDWGYYRCPTTHPYKTTAIMVSYKYRTETDEEVANLELASDMLNPSAPKGWSKHSDIHPVWDMRVRKMQHDGCINGRLNCSGGDLGNGWQLKGGSQPSYGWENPNRLVPADSLLPAPEAMTH